MTYPREINRQLGKSTDWIPFIGHDSVVFGSTT